MCVIDTIFVKICQKAIGDILFFQYQALIWNEREASDSGKKLSSMYSSTEKIILDV